MRSILNTLLATSVFAFALHAAATAQEASDTPSPKGSIDDLSWIAGHWQGEAMGGNFEETWNPPKGGAMMGMFKFIKDGQVNFYEILTIVPNNDSLVLRLKHFHNDLVGWEENDKSVEFPLISISEHEARFDGLIFKKISADEMLILVKNKKKDGTTQELRFECHRAGEQSIELVQKLAIKISSEKEAAESKWLEVRKKLGIRSLDENGNVVNPYSKRLFFLQDQQAKYKSNLSDVHLRAQMLSKSLKPDETTGIVDPVVVKVAALEAQDYLKLSRTKFRKERLRSPMEGLEKELRKLAMLEQRAWSMETKITELRLERARLKFSLEHKSIRILDEQIAVFEGQQAELMTEIAALKQYLDERSPDEKVEPESNRRNVETFREQESREWITMYQLALNKKQERLIARLKGINEEIEVVDKNAEKTSMGIVELNMLQRQINKKDAQLNSILERLSVLAPKKYNKQD